jgi:hypothetical protein
MGRHADVPGKEKRSACPGSAPFLAGVRPPSDVFWRRGLKPSQNTEKDELKPVESHVKKKKNALLWRASKMFDQLFRQKSVDICE